MGGWMDQSIKSINNNKKKKQGQELFAVKECRLCSVHD